MDVPWEGDLWQKGRRDVALPCSAQVLLLLLSLENAGDSG